MCAWFVVHTITNHPIKVNIERKATVDSQANSRVAIYLFACQMQLICMLYHLFKQLNSSVAAQLYDNWDCWMHNKYISEINNASDTKPQSTSTQWTSVSNCFILTGKRITRHLKICIFLAITLPSCDWFCYRYFVTNSNTGIQKQYSKKIY